MKYLLFVFILLLFSCKQPAGDVIKDNIREYLSKTIPGFNSYEPVEYGKLDTTFTSFRNTRKGREMDSTIQVYEQIWKEKSAEAESLKYQSPDEARKLLKETADLIRKVANISSQKADSVQLFKKEFSGYGISHSFRNKNTAGTTVLTTKYFILDSAYAVIKMQDNP